jgi:hypothetical protein
MQGMPHLVHREQELAGSGGNLEDSFTAEPGEPVDMPTRWRQGMPR